MDLSLKVERPASLVDLVIFKLEGKIIAGELPPETRLKEEKLATELNVSRTSVREAMYTLTNLGFIQRREHGGWTVGSIKADDVLARHELKTMLEVNAIRRSTQETREEVNNRLETIMAKMAEACEKGENTVYRHQDSRFHESLMLLHYSDYLNQLYSDNLKYIEWLKNISISPFLGMQRSFKQHKRIYLALKKHDIDKAEQELLIHDEQITRKIRGDLKNLKFIS